MLEQLSKNSYYTLRDEIIKNAQSFSRKITAFAMLEELNDLQAMFCYSQQELTIAKDEKLIIICHLIINKMREFINDMSEYGIDESSLNSFQSLTDQFQLYIDIHQNNTQKIDQTHDVLAH